MCLSFSFFHFTYPLWYWFFWDKCGPIWRLFFRHHVRSLRVFGATDGRERPLPHPHVLHLARGRLFPRVLQHPGRVAIHGEAEQGIENPFTHHRNCHHRSFKIFFRGPALIFSHETSMTVYFFMFFNVWKKYLRNIFDKFDREWSFLELHPVILSRCTFRKSLLSTANSPDRED